jgi:hypothetical protein
MEHAPAWLTNSLIYLGAAVLVVPLSRALGLGSIIGWSRTSRTSCISPSSAWC